MKHFFYLSLSRKQAVLLVWLVEAVIDFFYSLGKIDINIDYQELIDFRDYINLKLKSV